MLNFDQKFGYRDCDRAAEDTFDTIEVETDSRTEELAALLEHPATLLGSDLRSTSPIHDTPVGRRYSMRGAADPISTFL